VAIGRRSGWALAILAVVALSALSWAIPRRDRIFDPGRSPNPTSGWVRHQEKWAPGRYLVVRRPLDWKPYVLRECVHYTFPILYLSNTPLHQEVKRTANSLSCTGILDGDLPPGGVLLSWTIDWFPGPPMSTRFKNAEGARTDVGGHPAKIHAVRGGCSEIGGDREIRAVIDPGAESLYWVKACVRGPNLDRLQRDALNVIRSTRYAGISES
jgi:hypothetical protein